jgi:hypothetical protein
MTTLAPAARVFRVAFFLAFAALTSACETGGDGPGAASANVEVTAEAKAGLAPSKTTLSDSAGARLEARAVPGQAQLDVAAAQLAEANARLNAVANAGASVEANAQPGNPSLKVGKSSAVVDAKVQPGNPSLNIGKAGTLIDANVQAGSPSLNIGGLKAAATAASAGTQANTTKTGANAGAKGKVNIGIGQ